MAKRKTYYSGSNAGKHERHIRFWQERFNEELARGCSPKLALFKANAYIERLEAEERLLHEHDLNLYRDARRAANKAKLARQKARKGAKHG